MPRPITTLFMLMSIDAKITSGDSDDLDSDRDWKRIHGVKEGLFQYYDLEKQTDLCFLQSGRTFEKIGLNEREPSAEKLPVTGVIIDNKPHLNEKGLRYLSSWLDQVLIVTSNANHPARAFGRNINVILYNGAVDFPTLFTSLKETYHHLRYKIIQNTIVDD